MNEAVSRSSLATICVAYLSSIEKELADTAIEESWPPAAYSASSWIHHARLQDTTTEVQNTKLFTRLLHPNGVGCHYWVRNHDEYTVEDISETNDGRSYETCGFDAGGLYCASRHYMDLLV